MEKILGLLKARKAAYINGEAPPLKIVVAGIYFNNYQKELIILYLILCMN